MADIGSFDFGSKHGLFFSARVPGAHGFVVALSRFGEDLGDYSPFWNGAFKTWWYANRQVDYVEAGFDAPLSAAYRAWKNRHYPSAPILVLTGRMKASLVTPDAAGSVWRPRARSLDVGSTVPYAIYHQTGTRRMPARRPIRIAQADRERLGKLLQAYVAEAWKKRRAAAAAGGQAA